MAQTIYQVDAFSDRPFAGNPAAICILPGAKPDDWMQHVAAEMNLSETAFLVKQNDGYDLRWFTPTTEVDLCGHATLASAHILWERGHLQPDQTARFQTHSGLLTALRRGDWIEMDFPAEPAEPASPPDRLIEALGTEPTYVGQNRLDYLVELASEDKVRSLDPNFSLLKCIPGRGIIVTSAAEDYDFVSRYFAPSVGIPEDPVTGSAHCCLGPYWQDRLGKDELVGYQASARGGIVRVRVGLGRVYLGGQAVTVLRGELL
jgi:PhzF family phenazine biosynthesis protein